MPSTQISHVNDPIDMVLHCPRCGMQHIDKDNHDELRIEAAELGVDREEERELERWIEEREWSNPPHRSHLCQNRKCGHIWRPADVPTNGVAAIKTAGTRDDPITSPQAAQPIACSYGDNGYACCEGGPCQADLHNDQLAPQAAQLVFTKEWCVAAAKAEEDSGADISAGVPACAGSTTLPSVEFQILKAEHDNLKSSYDRLRLAYEQVQQMAAGEIDAKQMTLNAVDKAPKDSTVVLMWLEGFDIPHPVRFQDGKWRSSWDGDEVNLMVGWMHIPNVVSVK